MNTQLILQYLSDLNENNNREWYHSHKMEKKAADTEFEAVIESLILRIGKFDSSVLHNEPKNLTFKLARDTRFSHDKSPYNRQSGFPRAYFLTRKASNPSRLLSYDKIRQSIFFRRRLICGYVQRGNEDDAGLYCSTRRRIRAYYP